MEAGWVNKTETCLLYGDRTDKSRLQDCFV
jgi:hypothetical protein